MIKLTVRAIVTAAAAVDIHLVVLGTERKKDVRLVCITLACDQSRAYMPPKSVTFI